MRRHRGNGAGPFPGSLEQPQIWPILWISTLLLSDHNLAARCAALRAREESSTRGGGARKRRRRGGAAADRGADNGSNLRHTCTHASLALYHSHRRRTLGGGQRRRKRSYGGWRRGAGAEGAATAARREAAQLRRLPAYRRLGSTAAAWLSLPSPPPPLACALATALRSSDVSVLPARGLLFFVDYVSRNKDTKTATNEVPR